MAKQKMNIESLRNLPQYKNKTDMELEKIRAKLVEGDTSDRVEEILQDFEENYDLSDMTANDLLSLKNLVQYYVYLEELNISIQQLLVEDGASTKLDQLFRIMERIQSQVSSIQTNLAITRKQRKSDKEQDIVSAWEDLKLRAKKFLSERLSYIYCPECKMLLANTWFLYPQEARNVLRLRCNRVINGDTGEICGHEFTVTSAELAENENKNVEGVLRT